MSRKLCEPNWECIHFLYVKDVDVLKNELKKEKTTVLHADVTKVMGKEGLLDLISKVMNFPDYFGKNWDALNDCLTDSHVIPNNGCILFLEISASR